MSLNFVSIKCVTERTLYKNQFTHLAVAHLIVDVLDGGLDMIVHDGQDDAERGERQAAKGDL